MKKILQVIGLIAVMCFVGVGCTSTATKEGREMAVKGDNVFLLDVPNGVDLKGVRASVAAALAERQWKIVKESDGRIFAELNDLKKRDVYGKLTIDYTTKLITVTDNSTDIDGKPFVAIRWDKYLLISMKKQLDFIAPRPTKN
jgi:hypothetical protein